MPDLQVHTSKTIFFQVLLNEQKEPFKLFTAAHSGLRLWAFSIIRGKFVSVTKTPGTLKMAEEGHRVVGDAPVVIDSSIYSKGKIMFFLGDTNTRFMTSNIDAIDDVPILGDLLSGKIVPKNIAIDLRDKMRLGKVFLDDYAKYVVSELLLSEMPPETEIGNIQKLRITMRNTQFFTKALEGDEDRLNTSYCVWAYEKRGSVMANVTVVPGFLTVSRGGLTGGGVPITLFNQKTVTDELYFKMGTKATPFESMYLCKCPENPSGTVDYPKHTLNIADKWDTTTDIGTPYVMIDLSLNDPQPADPTRLIVERIY